MYEGSTPLRCPVSGESYHGRSADDAMMVGVPPPSAVIGGNPEPEVLTVSVSGARDAGKSTLLMLIADLARRLGVDYECGVNVPFSPSQLPLTPSTFARPVRLRFEEVSPEEAAKRHEADLWRFFHEETARRERKRIENIRAQLADEGTRVTPPSGVKYDPSPWVGLSAIRSYDPLPGDPDYGKTPADCAAKFDNMGAPPFPYFNQPPAHEVGETDSPTTDIWVVSRADKDGPHWTVMTEDGHPLDGAVIPAMVATPMQQISAEEASTLFVWSESVDPMLKKAGVEVSPFRMPLIPPISGEPAQHEVTISVYVNDGRVFEYTVPTPDKAREHASAIIATGYRHCANAELCPTPSHGDVLAGPGEMEHYPPHRIDKVKIRGFGVATGYPDKTRGT